MLRVVVLQVVVLQVVVDRIFEGVASIIDGSAKNPRALAFTEL